MASTLTVATYNVLANSRLDAARYANLPASYADPHQRLAAIAKYLQALNADVLCLQEIDEMQAFELEKLLQPLPYVQSFLGSRRSDRGGCAIYYNFETTKLLQMMQLKYDYFLPPTERVAQLLETRVGDSTLVIVNTHLAHDAPGTPREEQLGPAQTKLLLDVIAQNFSAATGRIICGGMNAGPESDVVATLLASGYKDAHSALPSRATCNIGGPLQVDYVLHDAALQAEPLPHTTVTRALSLPNDQEPSDHVAVAAKLSW